MRLRLIVPFWLVMSATTAMTARAAEPHPTSDDDDDGLTAAEEARGWTVSVNRTGLVEDPISGWQDVSVVYEASSDPSLADTDGDGLTDLEERAVKSDPRLADTDMDGLDDGDEVGRWGTSPVSVDSDGDARGFLSDRTIFPYAAMFDAAELRLVRDVDGVWRAGPGATTPILDDTDGDGVNDYLESLNPLRSAAVAEVPRLDMRLTPGTMIEISVNGTKTDGSSEKVAYTSSTSSSDTWSASGTLMIGNETETWIEAETKETVKASIEGSSAKVSVAAEQSVEAGISTTMSVAVTFDGGFQQVLSKAESEARAAEASQEVTIDSGTVRLSLDITNTSQQTFTVVRLLVVAGTGHAHAGFRPLGTLTSESEDITLRPGETATVVVSNKELEAERVMALANYPGAIVLQPFGSNLLDEDGVDFDFRAQQIRSHTILLQVATDAEVAEQYYVAANVNRNGDGESDGIRLEDALQSAGLATDRVELAVPEAPGGFVTLYEIGGAGSDLHQGPAPDLEDPPYDLSGGPGLRLVRVGWFAHVLRYDPADLALPLPVDWRETELHPRDRVTLTRSTDGDRDGVAAHIERVFGTYDDATDSDLDGLSDFYEIAEGWEVDLFGAPPELVYSSPIAPDIDQDGLTDRQEFELKTHPWKADTDGDGLSDFVEAQLAGSALNGQERPATPEVTCRLSVATPPQALINSKLCNYKVHNVGATQAGQCLCSAAVRVTQDPTPYENDDWAFGSFLEECGDANKLCTVTSPSGTSRSFNCGILQPGAANVVFWDETGDGPDDAQAFPTTGGDGTVVPIIQSLPPETSLLGCMTYYPLGAYLAYYAGCALRDADGDTCPEHDYETCFPVWASSHPAYPLAEPDAEGHPVPLGICGYFNHIPCWVDNLAWGSFVTLYDANIEVTDPQGDLVSVRVDVARDHFRTEWKTEPTGSQTHTIPLTISGSPGDVVITATDAFGMTTTRTCAAAVED